MTLPVLVEVRRGAALESVHAGAVVVTNSQGEIVAAAGDPGLRSFARSSIKPLQALPLIADGGAERFALTDSEIAVVCGSHSGEDYHLAAVRSILRKVGLSEDALRCGTHFPLHEPSALAMRARGEAPRQVHDNCSGKHAGMLALAQRHGWDPARYLEVEHGVQARIRDAIIALTGSETAVERPGVDGCGAPTYFISLRELATGFARLARPDALPAPWASAARIVTQAMMRFPEMVAGTARLDTVLMSLAAGRVFAKGGGEAIFATGLPERGLGIALKISDGGGRAVGPAAVETLLQLGVLSTTELHTLAPRHQPPVVNRRGEEVGAVVPVFSLGAPSALQ